MIRCIQNKSVLPIAMLGSLCLVQACAPGELAWSNGDSPLRTAIYSETMDGEALQATLFLSNGQFPCDFPSHEDPADQSQALLDILVAACREDARHVRIDLWRHDQTTPWQGRYPGRDVVDDSQISSGRPRLATASYYGINEAELVAVDGFERVYAATDEERVQIAAVGGEVVIEHTTEGLLKGEFGLPEADVSGRFRAEVCPGSADLLDLLTADPLLTCP